MRHALLIFATVIASTLLGCDKPQTLCLVHGEVFVKNQPATGALVIFSPVNGDASDSKWEAGFPRGYVDSSGKFELTTSSAGDGAPAGDYVVLITWTGTGPDEEVEETEPQVDKLKGRYATTDKSDLHVTVQEGMSDLPRFDLKP